MSNYFNLQLDTTAPSDCSVSIDAGAAYATSQSVTATIGCGDGDTTGYQMKVWGDVDTSDNANIQASEGASAWISYSTSQAVKLSTGDALKTINVRIRDDVGNAASPVSDTITLDQTIPTINITVAASPTKISKIATFDTSTFSFQSDVAIQAWKVKVVPATNSLDTAGAQIPTTAGSTNVTGGALAATTNQSVSIKGADLEAASAGDGTKIVKIFGQDLAGVWSV